MNNCILLSAITYIANILSATTYNVEIDLISFLDYFLKVNYIYSKCKVGAV